MSQNERCPAHNCGPNPNHWFKTKLLEMFFLIGYVLNALNPNKNGIGGKPPPFVHNNFTP